MLDRQPPALPRLPMRPAYEQLVGQVGWAHRIGMSIRNCGTPGAVSYGLRHTLDLELLVVPALVCPRMWPRMERIPGIAIQISSPARFGEDEHVKPTIG